MKNSLLFLGFLLHIIFVSSQSFAQTGSLKGQVVDIANKELLVGATVMVENTAIATSTDIDGNFTLPNIKTGKCNIVINYVSYKTKTIENVEIYAGKVTELKAEIEEDANVLGEATVVGQRETFTELSVISEIKSVQNVAVGISGEQISKSQDRDASQAIRRVPGVSLVDNRFVMVRGLSQRYNTVLLNDIITPSSEVDTRSFSFDIVPSNIIDRMMVYKAGASDISGDFAGGLVKIYTKNAPEQNFTTFGINIGYRPNTTFQTAQTYQGGKLDFLGFDDGSRKMPALPSFVSSNTDTQVAAQMMNQFKGGWSLKNTNILPDLRFNFGLGRRFKVKGMTIGTLTSMNFSNTQQYADVNMNFYLRDNSGNSFNDLQRTSNDQQITNNIRLGVLHNWSFRFNKNHSIEFKNLFNQLSFVETTVRDMQDYSTGSGDGTTFRNYSLRFESRSIYSGQLVGKHDFLNERLNMTWQLGYANTNRQEPDWRRVRTIKNGDSYRLSIPPVTNATESGRFFSNLNEGVMSAASSAEWAIGKKPKEKAVKLRAGFYLERKDRNFQARFFGYSRINAGDDVSAVLGLTPDVAFSPLHVTGLSGGLTMNEGTRLQDKYTANSTLLAGYIGATIPITEKFTISTGLRIENNTQQLNSKKLSGEPIAVNNPLTFLLPSINLTYDLTNKTLLRLAYSQTVNRPEFRELAPFDFFDFNTNSSVVGNTELKTATIQNVDMRWEYYPSPAELVSVGVFYKHFINPIENFLQPSSGNISYTYINAKNASNYGVELELRKSLAGLTDKKFFDNINLVANASFIKSTVDLGQTVRVGQTDGSVVTQFIGDTQDTQRPMALQSPYLINAGLYYADENSGWQASLMYNIYGQRIFAVGNRDNPTIYEIPRNIIDFSLSKQINKKLEFRMSIQDLLNQPFLIKQDSNQNGKIDKGDNNIRNFRRGQYFSFGFNYTF